MIAGASYATSAALSLIAAATSSAASPEDCRSFYETAYDVADGLSGQDIKVAAMHLTEDQTRDFLAAGIGMELLPAEPLSSRPDRVGLFVISNSPNIAYMTSHDSNGCKSGEASKITLVDLLPAMSKSLTEQGLAFKIVITGDLI